jgi:hypothetical protein
MGENNSLQGFMRKNRATKTNINYKVSDDLDEFVLKPIKPKENDVLVNESMEASMDSEGNSIRIFNEAAYREKLIIASVTNPNLLNASLQDFYGVTEPGDLINEMLTISEYRNLFDKIQEINGFGVNLDKKVKEAKN